MLIHDPASGYVEGRGTEEDHRKAASMLSVIAGAYADVYAKRAGISREEAREIMRKETVLDGDAAILMGFADEYDREEQAAAVAAFDYRIYANAPAQADAEMFGQSPKREAVLAMMAGLPALSKEIVTMTDKPVEDLATEETSVVAEAEETTPAVEEPVAHVDATKAERDRARRILDIVAVAQLPVTMANDLIDAGASVEKATEAVVAAWKEKGDMDTPTKPRPTAQILRDERDTRREGLTMALTAQLQRAAPESDKARPYMNMSLVEMAAVAADYKGSMRTVSDRLDVFMAASHSTSDFPAIFENALNKTLLQRYTQAQPTYRNIARQTSFNDFRPHPMVRTGDFPTLQPIAEGGEIKFGTFGESRETVAVQAFGVGVRITRQMLVNDDLNAIAQVVSDQGLAVARFEDQVFYNMMLTASGAGPTLLSTTRAVFNTTDQSLAGTGAAIDVASLSAARAALRKRTGIDGALLEPTPAILLVGPDRETQAQQIVSPIQAAQAGSVNVFSGTLRVVVSARITGNAWYLFADPSELPNFVYGYLNGAAGPRMRTEEPFGHQGTSMTIEHDFGCGAIDFRGGWRNPGA
jgi:hypothetical protein